MLQGRMNKIGDEFFELLGSVGTASTEIGRDRAKIMGGRQQLVRTAARVMGKNLIVCTRAVKWWNEDVK